MLVGGGHNGLTAAAYVARAAQSVGVLERRERLGGPGVLKQSHGRVSSVESDHRSRGVGRGAAEDMGWPLSRQPSSWPRPTHPSRRP
ncbi:MAG: NAD(P)-binding protein [Solirubrobacterales bacterium]